MDRGRSFQVLIFWRHPDKIKKVHLCIDNIRTDNKGQAWEKGSKTVLIIYGRMKQGGCLRGGAQPQERGRVFRRPVVREADWRVSGFTFLRGEGKAVAGFPVGSEQGRRKEEALGILDRIQLGKKEVRECGI